MLVIVGTSATVVQFVVIESGFCCKTKLREGTTHERATSPGVREIFNEGDDAELDL